MDESSSQSTPPTMSSTSTENYKLDGRSKRIKWETNKQLIPAKPVKPGSRPVKPSGPEHKYFETIAWSEEGSRRVKCNYCPHELWANTQRMRHHIVNNCLGQVPDEVKLELTLREGDLESKKLKEIKKQVIKTQSKITGNNSRSSLSSPIINGNGTYSDRASIGGGNMIHIESESEDCNAVISEGDDGERVAKLLKSLIKQAVPTSRNNTSKESSGHNTYTDEEYTSITRELTIQKMKLELELMQDQKRVFSKLNKGLDTLTKAANLWIDREERELQSANLTVYTGEGDSYLAEEVEQNMTEGQS